MSAGEWDPVQITNTSVPSFDVARGLSISHVEKRRNLHRNPCWVQGDVNNQLTSSDGAPQLFRDGPEVVLSVDDIRPLEMFHMQGDVHGELAGSPRERPLIQDAMTRHRFLYLHQCL